MSVADQIREESLTDPVSRQPSGVIGEHARGRVFFLVDSLELGGTESQAAALALGLSQSRYAVTVGCLRARGPLLIGLREAQVPVIEFHPPGGLDSILGLYKLLSLSWFLRRGRFDIVHTHDLWSNLMGVPAALLARVPVIISSQRDLSHLPWYRPWRRRLLRSVQGLCDVLVTNASAIRDQLVGEHFPLEKVRVIQNGVDLRRFSAAAGDSQDPVRGAGPGKRIVLVGNMTSDVKGHPWLIRAAPAVLREFPDTHFVLAGNGEKRPNFERIVADLNLTKSFSFLGQCHDIPSVLSSCDIAVLPSRAEGLPNAVLEYMAAALPTVASKVGGNVEIMKDGVTGLLVAPENADALAAALLQLLRDPCLADRLGTNGREYVRQNFSFEKLVERIDGLYSDLLRTRKPAKSQL
ncbi:MAG: glycosyltransferase [Candidatus Sulfotelmatobacter sp.]